jgi:soluble lytic murein transglycosylase
MHPRRRRLPLPRPLRTHPREDDSFLLLREAARQDDAAKAAELAARLPNYAIPSYVDYYRLKPRLKERFERGNPRFPQALRRQRHRRPPAQRLAARAGRASATGHLRPRAAAVRARTTTTQVKCYALLSRAVKGQNVAA